MLHFGLEVLEGFRCRNQCAKTPPTNGTNQNDSLPFFYTSDVNTCSFGFGDVVALVDNKNEVVAMDNWSRAEPTRKPGSCPDRTARRCIQPSRGSLRAALLRAPVT